MLMGYKCPRFKHIQTTTPWTSHEHLMWVQDIIIHQQSYNILPHIESLQTTWSIFPQFVCRMFFLLHFFPLANCFGFLVAPFDVCRSSKEFWLAGWNQENKSGTPYSGTPIPMLFTYHSNPLKDGDGMGSLWEICNDMSKTMGIHCANQPDCALLEETKSSSTCFFLETGNI